MKIFPAIDLMGGACVRLSRGDFGSKKVYDQDPAAVLARFRDAGAESAHIVDLDGAKDPRERQTALLESLARSTTLKLQAGGGIRSVADAQALLSAGMDRVVVGTSAVEKPSLFHKMLDEFGGNRLTLAVDAFIGEKGATVASRGWTRKGGQTPGELIEAFLAEGLERVLCTDISKDGMLQGPNVPLYRELAAAFPSVELQASGGVRSLEDLLALKAVPVHSAIVGKALYEKALDLAEAVRRC